MIMGLIGLDRQEIFDICLGMIKVSMVEDRNSGFENEVKCYSKYHESQKPINGIPTYM